MKILSAGSTDKGRKRTNNEDAFLVDDESAVYAVADGIGGHSGGEVASRTSVDVLREIVKERIAPRGLETQCCDADTIASELSRAFKLANSRIREAGSRNTELYGMGTTLTALLVQGTTAYVAHIGDSRAYLFRNGQLEQLSEDHGVVAEQVRAGLITPDQARKSPYRHIITRALGIEQDILVDHRTVRVMQNDAFLLCSDGLTEMIGDLQIEAILRRSDPEAAVGKLIAAANDKGGVDNITVVLIKIEDLA